MALPQFVKDEFDAFLQCGIVAHDLAPPRPTREDLHVQIVFGLGVEAVAALRKAYRDLDELASDDGLTGLPYRRRILEVLAAEIQALQPLLTTLYACADRSEPVQRSE